jgi:hypothetical protein
MQNLMLFWLLAFLLRHDGMCDSVPSRSCRGSLWRDPSGLIPARLYPHSTEERGGVGKKNIPQGLKPPFFMQQGRAKPEGLAYPEADGAFARLRCRRAGRGRPSLKAWLT